MEMDLAERILNSVKNSDSALWFPELTGDLAKVEWKNLEEKGITPANYGTARVVLNDPAGPRNILTSVFVNGPEQSKIAIPIELLPSDISQQYKESNITFYSPERFTNSTILKSLVDAFEIIRTVPTLFENVATLVRSLHLIKPGSDDYDVSFSEPDIPFSIFVSVPREINDVTVLRVAEAIVHEAMHLQLTLIERITPLVANNREGYFSPWRQEYRTSQGNITGNDARPLCFQNNRSFFNAMFDIFESIFRWRRTY
jgi:hypothetical protein